MNHVVYPAIVFPTDPETGLVGVTIPGININTCGATIEAAIQDAANILQEILTVKSDDVIGRAKTYEAIVKGDNLPKPNVPESFNVLVHELRGLALEITMD